MQKLPNGVRYEIERGYVHLWTNTGSEEYDDEEPCLLDEIVRGCQAALPAVSIDTFRLRRDLSRMDLRRNPESLLVAEYVKTPARGIPDVILGLLIGVAVAAAFSRYGLLLFEESSRGMLIAISASLVTVATGSFLVFLFRRKISYLLWKRVALPVEAIGAAAADLLSPATSPGRRQAQMRTLGEQAALMYGWVASRRFASTVLTGLFASFVAVAGSYILVEQNSLIEGQNALIREQNGNLVRQFKQQADAAQAERRRSTEFTLWEKLADETFTGSALKIEALDQLIRMESEGARSLNSSVGTDVHMRFRGVYLSYATLSDVHLERTDLQGVWLDGARVEKSYFNWADMSQSDMSESTFDNVDFSRAIFRGANLKGAMFWRSVLTGASFDLADLRGTTIQARTGCGGCTFDGAIYDSETAFPAGVAREESGALPVCAVKLDEKWTPTSQCEADRECRIIERSAERSGTYSDIQVCQLKGESAGLGDNR